MKLKIFLCILCIIFSVIMVSIAVSDLIDVMLAPELFMFGTEVGGWKYESEYTFMIFNSIQATLGLLFLTVIIAFLLKKNKK